MAPRGVHVINEGTALPHVRRVGFGDRTAQARLAYVEVLPTDRRGDAIAFLERALLWYRAQGIVVEEVMTDNGPAYVSHAWRERCAELRLRHLRTRPYTPRTDGKAERFIQTLLRGWAHGFGLPHQRPSHSRPLRLAAVVQQAQTP